ncbi:hypothetical protein TSAR_001393 [Trichomalopsis sarcophagae]|uniref:Uncharacterized protein n=1 Tax=Trichomalopsis sarcophagae TaxID=543379 RepID=A0A232EPS1_9HYME|nr:hypothetical protein TSAR_001393 [Trichomalopsis sarcophagae]
MYQRPAVSCCKYPEVLSAESRETVAGIIGKESDRTSSIILFGGYGVMDNRILFTHTGSGVINALETKFTSSSLLNDLVIALFLPVKSLIY